MLDSCRFLSFNKDNRYFVLSWLLVGGYKYMVAIEYAVSGHRVPMNFKHIYIHLADVASRYRHEFFHIICIA